MALRIAPHKPVTEDPAPRRSFTKKQRQTVWDRQEGLCLKCDGLMEHIDHVIPLELLGKHDISNWQGLCVACHRIKTALDQKLIAKTRRLRKREAGERRPRKKIPSRPFPKRKGKKDGKNVVGR